MALGSPVDPEVMPNSATSSRPVRTVSKRTGFVSAARSSSASWFAVPSNPTTVVSVAEPLAAATSSSISRVSHSACVTCALSMIWDSSLARSMGMVLTTTAPALVAASQQATIAGLLADRISTRLPGRSP